MSWVILDIYWGPGVVINHPLPEVWTFSPFFFATLRFFSAPGLGGALDASLVAIIERTIHRGRERGREREGGG